MSNSYLFQEEIYRIPPQVTIVLPKPIEEYVPAGRDQLDRILNAIQQSRSSVQIMTGSEVALDDFSGERNSHVIVFGAAIEGMASYEVIEAQGFSVVQADDLIELNQDEERRKRLWQALKRMFGL